MKQFLNFINGDFVATAKTFENRNPATNEVVGLVHEAGQAEVDAAVAAGRAALKGEWGTMSVVKRAELLHAVADEINRRFDDFLAAELADTGKPRSLASHIDIPRGAANFKIFADIVKNVPTESFQMSTAVQLQQVELFAAWVYECSCCQCPLNTGASNYQFEPIAELNAKVGGGA